MVRVNPFWLVLRRLFSKCKTALIINTENALFTRWLKLRLSYGYLVSSILFGLFLLFVVR